MSLNQFFKYIFLNQKSPQFLLELGIRSLCIDKVEKALKRGALVNDFLPNKMLPLSYLFSQHSLNLSFDSLRTSQWCSLVYHSGNYRIILEKILEAGANPNKKDAKGLSPLSYVITYAKFVSEDSPNSLSWIEKIKEKFKYFKKTGISKNQILDWISLFQKKHLIDWQLSENEKKEIFAPLNLEGLSWEDFQYKIGIQVNLISTLTEKQSQNLDWSVPMVMYVFQEEKSHSLTINKGTLFNALRCFSLAYLNCWEEIWKNPQWGVDVIHPQTGDSLLHIAAANWPLNTSVVERLIEKDLNPFLKNKQGVTPMDLIQMQKDSQRNEDIGKIEILFEKVKLRQTSPLALGCKVVKRL